MVHSNNSSIVDVEVLAVITSYSVNFGTVNNSPNFVWVPETGTYSLTFMVIKTLSNGETDEEEITLDGLIPGGTVSYTSDDLNDEIYFGDTIEILNNEVPFAPASESVAVTGISEITLALGSQGGNIANPTTQNQNSTTKNYTIGGIVHEVTVTYDSITNSYNATAIKK